MRDSPDFDSDETKSIDDEMYPPKKETETDEEKKEDKSKKLKF